MKNASFLYLSKHCNCMPFKQHCLKYMQTRKNSSTAFSLPRIDCFKIIINKTCYRFAKFCSVIIENCFKTGILLYLLK